MLRFGQEGKTGGSKTVSILFDGKPLAALPGDTVASALYAAGIRSWRQSRAGDERGLLCGIGLCFDCLLTVDGSPNLRACQTVVKEGMVVQTNREAR